MSTLPTSFSAVDAVKPLAAAPVNHAQRRQIRSIDLLGSEREILIEHAGELYSLRQTSKGKLILTK